MKVIIAAALLMMLGACGTNSPDTAAQPVPRTTQALPPAPPPPPMPEGDGACPADVNPCPDGSFVRRNPAKGCAFDPCPGTSNP
jgi:hypothetical protein